MVSFFETSEINRVRKTYTIFCAFIFSRFFCHSWNQSTGLVPNRRLLLFTLFFLCVWHFLIFGFSFVHLVGVRTARWIKVKQRVGCQMHFSGIKIGWIIMTSTLVFLILCFLFENKMSFVATVLAKRKVIFNRTFVSADRGLTFSLQAKVQSNYASKIYYRNLLTP